MIGRLPLLLLSLAMVAAVALWAPARVLATQQSVQPVVEDLVLGTWVLNVAKSTYSPGPAPRSQTRTYEAHEKGVKASIKTVDAAGNSTFSEYIAAYDGIEYPLTGSPTSNGIALKKIDAYTAEVAVMHAGKPTGTARRVISRDGKTMTITYRASTAGFYEAVYDRQGAVVASLSERIFGS